MKRLLPTLKALLVCSAVILPPGFAFATDATDTPKPATGSMAGPGFLGRNSDKPSSLALFGFGSMAYLTYPSIWGILEITEAQGKDLQTAWNEIMLPVQDAYSREADADQIAKRKQAEAEFKKRLNEALDDHQKEARSTANRFFGELGKEVAAQKLSGDARKAAIEEKVQSVFRKELTPSQLANWDAVIVAGKNCEP
jgi:hypothetical protein